MPTETSKQHLDVPIATTVSLGAKTQVVDDHDKELVKPGRGNLGGGEMMGERDGVAR